MRTRLVEMRHDRVERHAAFGRDLVVAGLVSADDANALTVEVDIEVSTRAP